MNVARRVLSPPEPAVCYKEVSREGITFFDEQGKETEKQIHAGVFPTYPMAQNKILASKEAKVEAQKILKQKSSEKVDSNSSDSDQEEEEDVQKEQNNNSLSVKELFSTESVQFVSLYTIGDKQRVAPVTFPITKEKITFGYALDNDIKIAVNDDYALTLWYHPKYQRYFIGEMGENTKIRIEEHPSALSRRGHSILGNLCHFTIEKNGVHFSKRNFTIQYNFSPKMEEYLPAGCLGDNFIEEINDFELFKTMDWKNEKEEDDSEYMDLDES